jgi:3-dehydroquinate dehydratase-1
MNTVIVRDVVIGEGIPKICVPIFEKTKEEILSEAKNVAGLQPDIVEFRADRFGSFDDTGSLLDVLSGLRDILGNIPVIFTFRTSTEGGEAEISEDGYAKLVMSACESGQVDLVDVEAFKGEELGNDLIGSARSTGVKVVASHHDFEKTPAKDIIVKRLVTMQETGADIIKIAVMPRGRSEVVALIAAAEEMVTEHADRPVVAISMGEMGVASRSAAEAFGSAMTFGAASRQSAPGQVGIEELREALQDFHEELAAEEAGEE